MVFAPATPRSQRLFFTILLIGGVLTSCLLARSQESRESSERKRQLAYFADESRIDELVVKFSAKYHAQDFAIRDVTLISTTEGRAIPGQSVAVADGRISKVGPSDSIKASLGMNLTPVFVICLIAGPGATCSQDQPKPIAITKVRGTIYLLDGATDEIGASVGKDGVLLVDGGTWKPLP